MENDGVILEALRAAPRWQVVHWGDATSSTLLCLWVAGDESLVSVDGSTARHAGESREIDDGGLAAWLREIQNARDRVALITPGAETARRWLLANWPVDHDDAAGAWRFPGGGSLRWTHSDGLLHLEVSENGDYGQPLPEPLLHVLVDLGWNPPDANFRNCWLQPGLTELDTAADLVVLTTMTAFGYAQPPPLPSD